MAKHRAYINVLINVKIAILFRATVPAISVTKNSKVKISIFSMKSFDKLFS